MLRDCDDQEGIELWPLIESYCADVDRELAARQNAWPPDFAQIHVHEVIGGMLAREATLAKDVGARRRFGPGTARRSCCGRWRTPTSTWRGLLDPVERCRKFILFGLGQAHVDIGKWSSLSVRQMAEGSGLHRFLQLRLHPVQCVCSFDVAPCCALRSQAVRQSIAPAPSSSDQRGTSPGPPLSDARREVLEQDARHLRSDSSGSRSRVRHLTKR